MREDFGTCSRIREDFATATSSGTMHEEAYFARVNSAERIMGATYIGGAQESLRKTARETVREMVRRQRQCQEAVPSFLDTDFMT